jgi:hypothetical protein
MMAGMITLILTGLLRVLRTRRALVLENLALRHQLAVLQRTAPRPRLRTSDRLLWVLLSHLWRGWAAAVSIVQPETVIRWQRAGCTLFWTWKSRRSGPGRPSVSPEVRALILHTGREIRTDHVGPRWGVLRSRGPGPQTNGHRRSFEHLDGLRWKGQGAPGPCGRGAGSGFGLGPGRHPAPPGGANAG